MRRAADSNRYDWGSDPLRGELGGEGERLYYSDAAGSITSLGLSNGGAATRYEYDAWGEVIASEGASLNTVLYTGQRLDAETGLMALGNGERYYSPDLGQFTQQDSLTGSPLMPQSLNRHAYAAGNPNKYVDPSGKFIEMVTV